VQVQVVLKLLAAQLSGGQAGLRVDPAVVVRTKVTKHLVGPEVTLMKSPVEHQVAICQKEVQDHQEMTQMRTRLTVPQEVALTKVLPEVPQDLAVVLQEAIYYQEEAIQHQEEPAAWDRLVEVLQGLHQVVVQQGLHRVVERRT